MVRFDEDDKSLKVPRSLGNYNNQGTGSGMTPEEVQAMIDSSLEDYTLTQDFATINDQPITEGGNIEVGGGSGSTVQVEQVLTAGTKIATITVDGDSTDLFAPQGGGGGGVTPQEVEGMIQSAITTDVQPQIDTLTGETAGLQSQIDTLTGETAGLQSQIDTLTGETAGLQSQIDALTGQTADLSANKQDKLTAGTGIEISGNTISCTVVPGSGGTTPEQVQSMIQSAITTDVQPQINTLTGETASLQGQVNTLTGETASLQGQVNTLTGETASLQGQVNTLTGQTADLSANKQDKLTAGTGIQISGSTIKTDVTIYDYTTLKAMTDVELGVVFAEMWGKIDSGGTVGIEVPLFGSNFTSASTVILYNTSRTENNNGRTITLEAGSSTGRWAIDLYYTKSTSKATWNKKVGFTGDQTKGTQNGAEYLPTATASVLGGVYVKSGLTVSSGNLSVKPATTSAIGGVIVGSGLTVDANGVLSATGGGGGGNAPFHVEVRNIDPADWTQDDEDAMQAMADYLSGYSADFEGVYIAKIDETGEPAPDDSGTTYIYRLDSWDPLGSNPAIFTYIGTAYEEGGFYTDTLYLNVDDITASTYGEYDADGSGGGNYVVVEDLEDIGEPVAGMVATIPAHYETRDVVEMGFTDYSEWESEAGGKIASIQNENDEEVDSIWFDPNEGTFNYEYKNDGLNHYRGGWPFWYRTAGDPEDVEASKFYFWSPSLSVVTSAGVKARVVQDEYFVPAKSYMYFDDGNDSYWYEISDVFDYDTILALTDIDDTEALIQKFILMRKNGIIPKIADSENGRFILEMESDGSAYGDTDDWITFYGQKENKSYRLYLSGTIDDPNMGFNSFGIRFIEWDTVTAPGPHMLYVMPNGQHIVSDAGVLFDEGSQPYIAVKGCTDDFNKPDYGYGSVVYAQRGVRQNVIEAYFDDYSEFTGDDGFVSVQDGSGNTIWNIDFKEEDGEYRFYDDVENDGNWHTREWEDNGITYSLKYRALIDQSNPQNTKFQIVAGQYLTIEPNTGNSLVASATTIAFDNTIFEWSLIVPTPNGPYRGIWWAPAEGLGDTSNYVLKFWNPEHPIWAGDQVAYNAIYPKDPNTLYFIDRL